MASHLLLSSSFFPSLHLKRHHHHHHHHFLFPKPHHLHPLPPLRAKNSDSLDASDRLISAACYLYPFLDGAHHGRHLLSQFPFFRRLLQPLLPAVRLFRASPFTGFLLFLTLYFAVVRNPSKFSRYVRFNTMQAIVLDVLLIFPDLLVGNAADGLSNGGFAAELVESLDSTVFLFLLVSLVYGSTLCLLGRTPRLPIVADAAEQQVL